MHLIFYIFHFLVNFCSMCLCASIEYLNCLRLPPNICQTPHPSESTSLFYISWPAGTPIVERKQSLVSEDATHLCFGASTVKWTPDQCQDIGNSLTMWLSGIMLHFPHKTHNSFVQTLPRPYIAWRPLRINIFIFRYLVSQCRQNANWHLTSAPWSGSRINYRKHSINPKKG